MQLSLIHIFNDVMRRRVALIAESISDLAQAWPSIEESMRHTKYSSLAIVPLVVSDLSLIHI